MLTTFWDQILLNAYIHCPRPGAEDVCLFVTPTIYRPTAKEFMFLRRTVYEILGHWSLGPYVDHWIHSVMGSIYATYEFPVMVEHFVKAGNSNIDYAVVGETMASNKAIRARIADATKLLNYLESKTPPDWNPTDYYKSLVNPEEKKLIVLDEK
jgi:hypothetical protein